MSFLKIKCFSTIVKKALILEEFSLLMKFHNGQYHNEILSNNFQELQHQSLNLNVQFILNDHGENSRTFST